MQFISGKLFRLARKEAAIVFVLLISLAALSYLYFYGFLTKPQIVFLNLVFSLLFLARLVKLFSPTLSPNYQSAAMALHAFIIDIFFQTYIFLFLTPLCLIASRRMYCKGSGTPLLLVHGYLHSALVWIYYMSTWKRAGFGPIYTLCLGFPFSSIKTYAKKLSLKAEEIRKETGEKELILIGHSMGGLISAYYAIEMAEAGSIKQVITIGAPLHGTRVASIALGKCAQEMRVHSPFTETLRKSIARAKGISFYNIGTKSDQLVIPYTSCFVVDDPKRMLLLEGIGHARLLFSKEISQQIVEWLRPFSNRKSSSQKQKSRSKSSLS